MGRTALGFILYIYNGTKLQGGSGFWRSPLPRLISISIAPHTFSRLPDTLPFDICSDVVPESQSCTLIEGKLHANSSSALPRQINTSTASQWYFNGLLASSQTSTCEFKRLANFILITPKTSQAQSSFSSCSVCQLWMWLARPSQPLPPPIPQTQIVPWSRGRLVRAWPPTAVLKNEARLLCVHEDGST